MFHPTGFYSIFRPETLKWVCGCFTYQAFPDEPGDKEGTAQSVMQITNNHGLTILFTGLSASTYYILQLQSPSLFEGSLLRITTVSARARDKDISSSIDQKTKLIWRQLLWLVALVGSDGRLSGLALQMGKRLWS
jgi:hypothetical protein